MRIARVTVTDSEGIIRATFDVDPDEAEGLGISVDGYLKEVIEVVCDGVADTLGWMLKPPRKEA